MQHFTTLTGYQETTEMGFGHNAWGKKRVKWKLSKGDVSKQIHDALSHLSFPLTY